MFLVLGCDVELWESEHSPVRRPLLVSTFGGKKDRPELEGDRWPWQPSGVDQETHYDQKLWWDMYRPT